MQTRQKGAFLGINPRTDARQIGENQAARSNSSEAPAASSAKTNAPSDVFSPIQNLSVELLNSKISHAERAAFTKVDQNPSGAELYARYAALCGAQKELSQRPWRKTRKTAVGEERQKRCLEGVVLLHFANSERHLRFKHQFLPKLFMVAIRGQPVVKKVRMAEGM